ncbi:MAG: SMI1/KNR4 family protein [Granulosicoccus sp.]
MNYSDVLDYWNRYAVAITRIGGDVQVLSVDPPANVQEIARLEEKLGKQLPPSLKELLLEFSKKVEFRWFMPNDYTLGGDLSLIFSGDMHWSLDRIIQFNEDLIDWRDEVFPNKDDPYDAIWHDKLAFNKVGNGDYFAVDLSDPNREPIVYLSHDDGAGHGIELASSFKEFVFTFSRIGCVGGEDWQWLAFCDDGMPHINSDCETAKVFREALGVVH